MKTQTITADDIVADVNRQMKAKVSVVASIDRAVKIALENESHIAGWSKQLRARPGTNFYVNLSSAKDAIKKGIELSVRTSGVSCGTVTLSESRRAFSVKPGVSKIFRDHWAGPKNVDWGDPVVAEYLVNAIKVADRDFAKREQTVEAALINQMKGGKTGSTALRAQQPVRFANLPLQFPVPVAPRGESEDADKKGHIDLIARRPGGRDGAHLRVLEIKAERAADSHSALDQAVYYATSLRWMLARDHMRTEYAELFGSKRTEGIPTVEAAAFVHQSHRKKILAARKRLQASNQQGIPLVVMLYEWSDKELIVEEVGR